MSSLRAAGEVEGCMAGRSAAWRQARPGTHDKRTLPVHCMIDQPGDLGNQVKVNVYILFAAAPLVWSFPWRLALLHFFRSFPYPFQLIVSIDRRL